MTEEQIAAEVETPIAEVVTDQNPTDQAPVEIVEKPTTQDDLLPKPDKSQSKFDKRIAQLNRKIGEQQARADMLERQLNESRPKPEVKSDGIRLEDFDFDVEKYAEAKVKAAEELAIKRYHEENQANSQKQSIQRLSSDWEAKAAKADDKYDDFAEVVGDLKPGSPVTIAIMQAENGEDIAYYLGNHLKEAQAIAALDPVSAVRAIGKLEAKLLAEPPKVSAPSKAPAPITPVSGSKGSNKTIFDDDVSQKEFEVMRRKQITQR